MKASLRPEKLDFQLERANLKPESAEYKSERADIGFKIADFCRKSLDLGSERASLRPRKPRGGGIQMDGQRLMLRKKKVG